MRYAAIFLLGMFVGGYTVSCVIEERFALTELRPKALQSVAPTGDAR